MKMEGETAALKRNLTEWRFSQYPKYILLPIDENHDQIRSNIKNVVFSEVLTFCVVLILNFFFVCIFMNHN